MNTHVAIYGILIHENDAIHIWNAMFNMKQHKICWIPCTIKTSWNNNCFIWNSNSIHLS